MPQAAASHRGTYRRLLGYTARHKGLLITGTLFAIICGSASAGTLFSLGDTLEKYFGVDMPDPSLKTAMLLPAFMLVFGFGQYFSMFCIYTVGFRVITTLRQEAFDRLQRLPLRYFTEQQSGDIISRISNDTVQVQQAVSSTVSDLVLQPFILLGSVGIAIYKLREIQALNASWALLVLPLAIVPVLIIGRKVRKYSRQNQERLAGLVSVLQENVAGVRIVKAFGMENYEQQKFARENQRVFSRLLKLHMLRALNQPLMLIVAALSIACTVVYASQIGMSIADFIVVVGAMAMAYQPVKRLGRVHMIIQQSVAAADRIFALIDEPGSIPEKPEAVPLQGEIHSVSFDQVQFNYGDAPLLDGVDLEVRAGQCIAIVGGTGSGKTSLVNLLPRFYDLTGGSIRINGTDIRDFTLASLRQNIGVVTQETFLFHDTIAANIAYGQKHPEYTAIEAAARKANAHDFILQKPNGYDSEVAERGESLSGGQRQRITLARAFYRDAPILILDEATSSLDNESERLVQKAIDKLMEGRVVFAIAHRLSTIKHADKIIVLDGGRIVEQGRHDELMQQNGTYRYLFDLQFSED